MSPLRSLGISSGIPCAGLQKITPLLVVARLMAGLGASGEFAVSGLLRSGAGADGIGCRSCDE